MPLTDEQVSVVGIVRDALIRDLRYDASAVKERWQYSEFTRSPSTRCVPLAAFAHAPYDYRSVCIAVVVPEDRIRGQRLARQYSGLGAPLLIEVDPPAVSAWGVKRRGEPSLEAACSVAELHGWLGSRQALWAPSRMYEAKFALDPQLDFVDLGLMPALESQVRGKLRDLLQRVDAAVREAYQGLNLDEPADTDRLLIEFGFVAAKLLRDRAEPGVWGDGDAAAIWEAIVARYSLANTPGWPRRAYPAEVLEAAWSVMGRSFQMQNIALDDLRFVYETTFIGDDTRRRLSIHATPTSVAEYVVDRLPIEEIAQSRRFVLEPFAGTGVFLHAAQRRLRQLLPPNQTAEEVHEYLRQRLVAVEIEPFARMLCWLALVLGDDLQGDGWRILPHDIFGSTDFDDELAAADIVLCNPPFDEFGADSVVKPEVRQLRTGAAAALHRVLSNPPSMLGFIVPESFRRAAVYRQLHLQIAANYGQVDLVRIPDSAFMCASEETLALLAWQRGAHRSVTVSCADWRNDHRRDTLRGEADRPFRHRLQVPAHSTAPFCLWVPRFTGLWQHLDRGPRLGAWADIRMGVVLKGGRARSAIADDEVADWRPCYDRAKGELMPYRATPLSYLEPEPENLHSGRLDWPWDQPKTVVNKHVASRGPWRLAAFTDYAGAVVTTRYWACWSKAEVPPEAITAVLNGPIANAYLAEFQGKRDVLKRDLAAIPMPELKCDALALLVDKVQRLQEALGRTVGPPPRASWVCRQVDEIDALVLDGYRLSEADYRAVLGLFSGTDRRLPCDWQGFDSGLELASTAMRIEVEFISQIREYQQLVDKKWSGGLTLSEEARMRELNDHLDDLEANLDGLAFARSQAQ